MPYPGCKLENGCARDAGNMHVIIVDDERVIADTLSLILTARLLDVRRLQREERP